MLENIEDRSEKLRDNLANHQLCEQALKVLTLLIQSSCASLKLEAYTVILPLIILNSLQSSATINAIIAIQ